MTTSGALEIISIYSLQPFIFRIVSKPHTVCLDTDIKSLFFNRSASHLLLSLFFKKQGTVKPFNP